MSSPTGATGAQPRASESTTTLIRVGILALLVAAAYRLELRVLVIAGRGFSEWSHVFAMPLVVLFYIRCRKEDMRAALTSGSTWGIVLILCGMGVLFTSLALGQFAYVRLLAMLACIAGLMLAMAGRRVLRVCVPLLLMLWLSMPLTERTMESKSLTLQRWSLQAGADAVNALPRISARAEGLTIAYQYQGHQGNIGLAEQRFAARLMPACFVVGLFTVFCRRRPRWHVLLLTLASVPVVLFCNVFRILAWAVVAIYGHAGPASSLPRNISFATSLVAAYGCFAFGCWALPRLGVMLNNLITVEVDDEEEAVVPAEPGVEQQQGD